MSSRLAAIAERAIGWLEHYDAQGKTLLACTALWRSFPHRMTDEYLRAYSDSVSIDCEPGLPTAPREKNLIRALGLTLIAELAERGEL